jgi:phosphoribosylformimino-5-aminoimidazole carboxamide ribotide isomerase
MRIIPAIDIIDGKCVRLSKGKYSTKKIYSENPLEVARQFEDNGIQHLHLVDLDGARSQHIVNYKILESLSSKTNLKIDFGGGLKSDDEVRIAFECGASQVTGGSIAAKDPEAFLGWLTKYGKEKIILGADCSNRKIVTHGWSESSEIDVVDYIKEYEAAGVTHVICTDVAKDGMLQGVSDALYEEIISKTNIKLIGSGGVSDVNDLIQLKDMGCEGAIVGKAIYEGKITLSQLQELC